MKKKKRNEKIVQQWFKRNERNKKKSEDQQDRNWYRDAGELYSSQESKEEIKEISLYKKSNRGVYLLETSKIIEKLEAKGRLNRKS